MIIYVRTTESLKDLRLTWAQTKAVNEQLDRCNQLGSQVSNDDFIDILEGDPIQVLVGGDVWTVFDTKLTGTYFVDPKSIRNRKVHQGGIVVADQLLYWELLKQSNHPVYWVDLNRCDETVWYGSMNDVTELLDDGYFPKLFHGHINPDGKSATIRVNGHEVSWEVVRWGDRSNPPPRIFSLRSKHGQKS